MAKLRLPKTFFTDHSERDLPTPTVIGETKKHFIVDDADPALTELLLDAEHYAHPYGPDCNIWLRSSAKATAEAIKKAKANQ